MGKTRFADDLDLVVRVTGHVRYRALTDPCDPAFRPDFLRIVRQRAAELRAPTGLPEAQVPRPAALPAPPADPPRYPSAGRMALNLIGSGVRTLRAALAGEPVLTPRQQADRKLAICRACPSQRFDPAQGRCLDCGCAMIFKRWLATEPCPRGHWSLNPLASRGGE